MPHINDDYDFSVSMFILHPTQPKVCLHFHKKLRTWMMPGGHIELDEDPIQALERELKEETGLLLPDCEILEPADHPNARGLKTLPLPMHMNVHNYNETHRHIDMQYLIKSNTDKFAPEDDESPVIQWLTIDEIYEKHKAGELSDGILDISQWIFDNYM